MTIRYDQAARNVLGGELASCSTAPLTGFFRNGCCETGPEDVGQHTVCAVMTAEFLRFGQMHAITAESQQACTFESGRTCADDEK